VLRRILRWAVGLPIVILVIAFAVANRRWTTLSFDPFTQTAPRIAMDMPLWMLFFIGIFVGLIVGWIGSWLAQGRHRKAARDARAELGRMQVELADLRKPREDSRAGDVVPFNGGFL
jgi:uncharacterized integral membrane protein